MATLNFIDLFDWEKESDVHYYSLINKEPLDFLKEEEIKLPATIIIQKLKNDNKNKNRTFSGINKKVL